MDEKNKTKLLILPVLTVSICLTMLFLEKSEVTLPSSFRVIMMLLALLFIFIYIILNFRKKDDN